MKKNESLMVTDRPNHRIPAFVEAEKMFDKLSAISRETAERAFSFFVDGGARIGNQAEDWLRAEMETLRAAPARITENKDTIKVSIAAPGFKPEDIEMSIKDKMLIVSGETTTDKEAKEETTFYSEWRSDRFFRQLMLPSEVEVNNAEALLKDGVLTLTLKKKVEVAPAKVAVKAA